jgi:LSD1 subclass zinc finger protein
MRTPIRLVSTLLALAAASCGGSESGATDPFNSTDLSESEQAALAAQLTDMAGSLTTSLQSQGALTADGSLLQNAATYQYTPNGSVACAVAGHMTYTGNITSIVNEASWSVSGGIVFQFGDRTNNLNDCEVAPDAIMDGTLNFVIAASSAEGIGWTMNGTITANRRGPTGGLSPRGSCFVMLSLMRGASKVTGSVCGYAVN